MITIRELKILVDQFDVGSNPLLTKDKSLVGICDMMFPYGDVDRALSEPEFFSFFKKISFILKTTPQDPNYTSTRLFLNALFKASNETSDDLLRILKKVADADQIKAEDMLAITTHSQASEWTAALVAILNQNIDIHSDQMSTIISSLNVKLISEILVFLKTNSNLLSPENIKMVINHERPAFILATLKSLLTINGNIEQSDLNRIGGDIFRHWRSDIEPKIEIDPLLGSRTALRSHCATILKLDPNPQNKVIVDAVLNKVKEKCKESLQLMERSVSDLAVSYIRNHSALQSPFPNGQNQAGTAGPILRFANLYSARYLDLYKAYVSIEKKKGIPMLPVTAGQLKTHGFTSPEIIEMQPSCKVYSGIVSKLPKIESSQRDKLISIMVGLDNLTIAEALTLTKATFESRTKISLTDDQYLTIIQAYGEYNQLDGAAKKLLNKAYFLMHGFGHMTYEKIDEQLTAVGDMDLWGPNLRGSGEDERLLMEIRHRVAGDSSVAQSSPGTLGGNPLAYLNVLTKGDPDNLEAEFRNKMYFVYMSNHFANAISGDDELVKEINQWLIANNKDWTLDPLFISTLRQRGAQYIPPVFRYGAKAALNSDIRTAKSASGVLKYHAQNPNISLRDAMQGRAHQNALHRGKLSNREYLNQAGELTYTEGDPRNERPLNYVSGAGVFNLLQKNTPKMSLAAQNYVVVTANADLPVAAGLSGTLDQSTTMAGLVGIAVSEDLDQRKLELETIRLAYLAFMLPGADHTVHEIMESSKTFGLSYRAGAGYEDYIYPRDSAAIKERLRQLQQARGSELPEYFLSAEYIIHAQQEMTPLASSSRNKLTFFGATAQESMTPKEPTAENTNKEDPNTPSRS